MGFDGPYKYGILFLKGAQIPKSSIFGRYIHLVEYVSCSPLG